MPYLSAMKAIISVAETDLRNKENILNELQALGTRREQEGFIELKPKSRKTTEVIRILRDHGIVYEITFDTTPKQK